MKFIEQANPEVRALLREHYPSINPEKIFTVDRGNPSSEDYYIETEGEEFVLSRVGWGELFGYSFEKRVQNQEIILAVSENMRKKGLQTPEVRTNKAGELVTIDNGQIYSLERFMGERGSPDRGCDFSISDIERAAEVYSQFMKVSTEMTEENNPLVDKVARFNTPYSFQDALTIFKETVLPVLESGKVPEAVKPDQMEAYQAMVKNRRLILDAFEGCANIEPRVSGEQYINHQDAWAPNVLFTPEQAQLIDFDNIGTAPDFIYDIAFASTRFARIAESKGHDRQATNRAYIEAIAKNGNSDFTELQLTEQTMLIDVERIARNGFATFERGDSTLLTYVPGNLRTIIGIMKDPHYLFG